jgi:hypothetical protein
VSELEQVRPEPPAEDHLVLEPLAHLLLGAGAHLDQDASDLGPDHGGHDTPGAGPRVAAGRRL